MSDLLIPLTSEEASYDQTVQLEGVNYVLRLNWNSTYSYWAMSIYNEQGEPLLLGVRLIIGVELLVRYRLSNLPPGSLLVVDFTDNLLRLGRETLDGDARLMYRESL